MSLDKKPRTFEIDGEYQSVFADGITLTIEENDTAKLIFYENTYEFDSNHGYDKQTKISRLKFEVKISLTTLNRLLPLIFSAIQPSLAVDTVKIRAMHKLSKQTITEIDKLGDEVIKRTFDTNDPPKYNNDIQEIFNSVTQRMLKDDGVEF